MARPTKKQRLNRVLLEQEKQKQLKFLSNLSRESLLKIARKLDKDFTEFYSKSYWLSVPEKVAGKVANIQEFWRILIND